MARYINAHSQALKVHLLGGRLIQPGQEFDLPDDLAEFVSQPDSPDEVPSEQGVAFDENRHPVRVGFEHPYIKPAKQAKAKADAPKTEEV